MSVNRRRPHIHVLPEDDANRQMANGFLLYPDLAENNIRVLEEVGGWIAVLDCFVKDHVVEMGRYPDRFMILLIDFDGHRDRLQVAKGRIPANLVERVFVLGSLSEPEELKRELSRPNESIGRRMAQDCREETDTIWGHDLLRHILPELDRLRAGVRPILFPGT